MKHQLASVALTLTCLSLAACGASSGADDNEGVGALSCAEVTPTLTTPEKTTLPATAAAPTGSRWFAFDAMRFGQPDAAASSGAAKISQCGWAAYALDLDGLSTDAAQAKTTTGACARVAGASPTMLQDGPAGVDDTFAAHVVPLLRELDGCLGDTRADERVTVLLRIDATSDADADEVGGALYVARDLGHAPARDGHDRWKVDAASLIHGALEAPVVRFAHGYVRGGVWVSGETSNAITRLPVRFAMSIGGCQPGHGHEIDLPLSSTRIVARLDGQAGVIAGALGVEALRDAMTPAMRASGICPESTTSRVMNDFFGQVADLGIGEGGAETPCNAVSFGMGFTMAAAAAPTEIAEVPAMPESACGAASAQAR